MGDNWHKLEPHTNGNGVICLKTTYCKNKILVTPQRFGAIGLPFGQQTQRRRCPVVHGGELLYVCRSPRPVMRLQGLILGLFGPDSGAPGPDSGALWPDLGPRGQILGLWGQILGLWGQILGLWGQILGLQGQILGLRGQILGIGARFWGSGARFWGSGARFWGSGVRSFGHHFYIISTSGLSWTIILRCNWVIISAKKNHVTTNERSCF